jgi:hypothetical protein
MLVTPRASARTTMQIAATAASLRPVPGFSADALIQLE